MHRRGRSLPISRQLPVDGHVGRGRQGHARRAQPHDDPVCPGQGESFETSSLRSHRLTVQGDNGPVASSHKPITAARTVYNDVALEEEALCRLAAVRAKTTDIGAAMT